MEEYIKVENGKRTHLARPFKREDDLVKILVISKMDIYIYTNSLVISVSIDVFEMFFGLFLIFSYTCFSIIHPTNNIVLGNFRKGYKLGSTYIVQVYENMIICIVMCNEKLILKVPYLFFTINRDYRIDRIDVETQIE